MSKKYKFHNAEGIYFITPTIVNWIGLFMILLRIANTAPVGGGVKKGVQK